MLGLGSLEASPSVSFAGRRRAPASTLFLSTSSSTSSRKSSWRELSSPRPRPLQSYRRGSRLKEKLQSRFLPKNPVSSLFMLFMQYACQTLEALPRTDGGIGSPAAYHPMPLCLPPHAPLSITPRSAGYRAIPRCLPPHALLATTPYTHIWRSEGGACCGRGR